MLQQKFRQISTTVGRCVYVTSHRTVLRFLMSQRRRFICSVHLEYVSVCRLFRLRTMRTTRLYSGSANLRQAVQPQQVIRDSNRDFRIQIAPRMLWIHYVVAECRANRPRRLYKQC